MPEQIQLTKAPRLKLSSEPISDPNGSIPLPTPRTAVNDPLNTGAGLSNASPIPSDIADELPSREKLGFDREYHNEWPEDDFALEPAKACKINDPECESCS